MIDSFVTLVQVKAYCAKHDDAPVKLTLEQETELREQPITGWDKDFVDVPLATLFHMILAANFLDIKPMLNLTCKVCRLPPLPLSPMPCA